MEGLQRALGASGRGSREPLELCGSSDGYRRLKNQFAVPQNGSPKRPPRRPKIVISLRTSLKNRLLSVNKKKITKKVKCPLLVN